MESVAFNKELSSKYELHYANNGEQTVVTNESNMTVIKNIPDNSHTRLIFTIPLENNEYFDKLELAEIFINDFDSKGCKKMILQGGKITQHVFAKKLKDHNLSDAKIIPKTSPENKNTKSGIHTVKYVGNNVELYNENSLLSQAEVFDEGSCTIDTAYSCMSCYNFTDYAVGLVVKLKAVSHAVIKNNELFITSTRFYPETIHMKRVDIVADHSVISETV